jgi:hypothetical protein
VFLVATIAIMALALTGCPGKSEAQKNTGDSSTDKGGSKSAQWEGTYEQQSADKMVISIKPDHKGSFGPAGQAQSEITWEVAGDDKIIVHIPIPMTMFRTSDGNLRDEEGATWKKK